MTEDDNGGKAKPEEPKKEETLPENITPADDFGMRRSMEEELSWLGPDNMPEGLDEKTIARIERLRRKHQRLLDSDRPLAHKRRGQPKNISKFPDRPKPEDPGK